MTQNELVAAIKKELKKSISQPYLSQLESGRRKHLTNTTRLLLAKFFKVHPGHLVDDPAGFQTELITDLAERRSKLDLWLIQGAERFRRDATIGGSAVEAGASGKDTRQCLLLLARGIGYQPIVGASLVGCFAERRKDVMNWPEIYLICFGVGTLWSSSRCCQEACILGTQDTVTSVAVMPACGARAAGSWPRSRPRATVAGLASWIGTC